LILEIHTAAFFIEECSYMSQPSSGAMTTRRGWVYTPAIGPRLRPWLWVSLGGFAILGATGVYLASVTLIEWLSGRTQQTFFYFLMLSLHVALGLLLLVPFIAFGFSHLLTARNRPNKAAVRNGISLLITSLVLVFTGVVLVQIRGVIDIRDPIVRGINYWLHVLTPLVAIAFYVLHRRAGPRIKWEYARLWGLAVALVIAAMAVLHTHDPRAGRKPNDPTYTYPSEVKLAGGKLISEKALMMDQYCMSCHQDAYNGWFHSSHRFSSFNNKAYLTSIRETRRVAMERDGDTRAARWCAGCHDPVPFFSGAFDDPDYDDVNTASSQAGITCVTCHAITEVGSSRGNADYTIEEPQHYPFAYSDNPVLQWVNQVLVTAKPKFHKETFLKPLHKDPKFCSACHKVGLPFPVNHYQEFTRGQNSYDTFLLSGVAGGNAKSFYYPPVAKENCNECHMGLLASKDFGAKNFDGTGVMKIHDHMFPGANTGLHTFRGREDIVKIHEKYLADKKIRVDLFALREGGGIDGKLLAPLRPEVPALEPGKTYLVESVVRTLAIGHPLTQGTVDSNEVWVELIARSGGRIIGRSGGIGPDGTVDPYAHFINVYMLDKHGNRIDRRNPQDIFVPLYNKQIPPGAAQVVHFQLEVPAGWKEPIELETLVNYRKFDRKYLDYIFGPGEGPKLPVVVMAKDRVVLPIAGGAAVENAPSPIEETWQRWNDYGIALLLEGGTKGGQKGELKQAEEAFQEVVKLGKADGWANLARVYAREGRSQDAYAALKQAAEAKEPAAPWVITFFSAQLDERNGLLDSAIEKYRSVLNTKIPERKFDFGRDYEVRNFLGAAEYARARLQPLNSPQRLERMLEAIATYRKTLAIDSENVAAHYGLGLAYADVERFLGAQAAVRPAPPEGSSTVAGQSSQEVIHLAENLAQLSAADARIPGVAANLVATIEGYLAAPREKYTSRLTPLQAVYDKVSPLFDEVSDPAARAAVARVLVTTHKSLHAMYKPDETAEGIAQRLARERDPAANQNAQSIVIRTLHRPGAPGIDASDETTAQTPTHDTQPRIHRGEASE
jgi:hypothetical protein